MKQGFTLIELLAVIVILAIIALIAVPIILNIIEDSKKSSQEQSLKMYGKALEQGIADYLLKHPNDKDITIDKIKNYINYSGEKVECDIFQIGNKGEVYLSDCTIGNKNVEYEYGTMIELVVDISNGLTPVIYDGDSWKITTSTDKNWYDYDNQKWANAVVLKQNSTKKVGDIVTVEGEDPDVLMMYVWIPRYEYKIEGTYGTHQDGTLGTKYFPGEIKVNFISKRSIATEGYHIHPAFTFGEKEESGFWVGKFELSHTELASSNTDNNLSCNNINCTNSLGFRILPNLGNLRFNSISNFWYAIKSIENTNEFGLINIDSHMIKNSEWGAVAYLSQSKYGKYGNKDYIGANKILYKNKSNYKTGYSDGTPGISSQATNYTQCEYNQKSGTNPAQDQINCGPGASTTGNVYGVYDMSGGSWEYVMGVYGDSDGIYSGYNYSRHSGFNGRTGYDNYIVINGSEIPSSKYYDMYANATNSSSNDGKLSCKNENEYGICYGHAISETRDWNSGITSMVIKNDPWMIRGGTTHALNSEMFSLYGANGYSSSNYTTRVVFMKNN